MTALGPHATGRATTAAPLQAPAAAWRALIVVIGGRFMALLDSTVVNVALPTMQTSLDASEAALSWVISGYALAFGVALIPAGPGTSVVRSSRGRSPHPEVAPARP